MNDVSQAASRFPAAPDISGDRQIAIWLLSVCTLVFAMVVVGGITRLTGSGLSMVAWEPISGILPPLSDAAWLAELDRYRQFPEYQKVNRGMTLGEFKMIFWWEYGHRLLGRVIGVAFAVPLVYFWARGMIRRELRWPLVGLFLLGGLQGVMGWYMVMSGLVDVPAVSHYRLTAHLSLAIIIYVAMLWVAVGLLRGRPVPDPALRLRDPVSWRLFLALVVLIIVQVVFGGFVAGLKAGFIYNTWPLMDGGIVPGGIWFMDPWWVNFLENHATVQFVHRMVAYALVAGTIWLWWRLRGSELSAPAHALMAVMVVQAILGILTLVYVVPVSLGAIHQGGAVVVATAFVWLGHRMARPGPVTGQTGA